MKKYYFTLLVADIPFHSGYIYTDNEEIASQMIEKEYSGKYDNYVIMENKGD